MVEMNVEHFLNSFQMQISYDPAHRLPEPIRQKKALW